MYFTVLLILCDTARLWLSKMSCYTSRALHPSFFSSAVLKRVSMVPPSVWEIYFIQSKNTCLHRKYVRNIYYTNVVYLTVVYKTVYLTTSIEIFVTMYWEKNYTWSSVHWMALTSRCATSTVCRSFCTWTKYSLFKLNIIVLKQHDETKITSEREYVTSRTVVWPRGMSAWKGSEPLIYVTPWYRFLLQQLVSLDLPNKFAQLLLNLKFIFVIAESFN